MPSRPRTPWKKSRTFGDIYGGRERRKIADRIFRRLHSLRRPGADQELPIRIQENPSRDHHFPLDVDECIAVMGALPVHHRQAITHVWLRRAAGGSNDAARPLAEYICGSGVRVVVMYPWRNDRRLGLGRQTPQARWVREYERFGARVANERGWWFAQFDEQGLRRYYTHVLFHEVGHHVDWFRRRWSTANGRACEDAADAYAVRYSRRGELALRRLGEDDG